MRGLIRLAWPMKAMARSAMCAPKTWPGRPVDTAVTYPGGINGVGFEGLRDFIRDHRQDQFINNLCRKLLSYALNRTLQLSDEALVDTMETNLAGARLSL